MKTHNQKRFFTTSISTSLSAALALTVSIASLTAAHADEYSDVCGGTQAPTGQKGSYCTAAKSSKDAAKKEKTLTLIYAAVAGTCAASCMSFEMATIACEAGALGAAATDAILTKNLTSALMGGISGGMGLYTTLTTGKEATTKLFGTEFKTSCITAATSSLSAFMHNSSRSSAESTAQSNLNSAKNLVDTTAPSGYTIGSPSMTTPPSSSTNVASTSSTATTLQPNGSSSSADPSAGCGDTSSVAGAASCAATADPQVASLVSTPEFQKAFEKSSGMKLDDYLKNGGNLSASDAIKASAGSALGEDGTAKLTKGIAAIEQVQPNFNAEASAAYAAGGHGGGASASGDADFNNMMSGLMSKLMPKSEQEKKTGVSEVKFSGPARNLASVTAEDPTVSLFERVAYRYSHVTPRLLSDPSKRSLSDWSATSPTAGAAAATKRN